MMEVVDRYVFYLTIAIDCLVASLFYTISSSSYCSNAYREIGASQCRQGNTICNGKSLGCEALFAGQRAPRWWMPAWSFLAALRCQGVLNVSYSPSLGHVRSRRRRKEEKKKKRAEQEEFGRGDIKEKKRGGGGQKCQLVLNLPVPRLLTVLGCCAS